MNDFGNEWKKFVLYESGFNRIMNILRGDVASVRSVAFLTAENPFAQKLPRAENKRLNQALMSWLRQRGYGPIRIRGKFGNPERSLIVPNISRHDAIEAGKEFDQEAIIWGEKRATSEGERLFMFYYIEGDSVIQQRDVVLAGEEAQAREDLYSQERQSAGRKFVIPFFDEEYEIDAADEEPSEYSLPPLSDHQRKNNKKLIKEINNRLEWSLEETRTPKSQWHHRQIARLRLRELRDKLR